MVAVKDINLQMLCLVAKRLEPLLWQRLVAIAALD